MCKVQRKSLWKRILNLAKEVWGGFRVGSIKIKYYRVNSILPNSGGRKGIINIGSNLCKDIKECEYGIFRGLKYFGIVEPQCRKKNSRLWGYTGGRARSYQTQYVNASVRQARNKSSNHILYFYLGTRGSVLEISVSVFSLY